jgi:hypothetical protein
LAFLVITLAIGSCGGLISGLVVKKFEPPKKYFVDSEHWEVPNFEEPYYFDDRGEVLRIDERFKELNQREGKVTNAQLDSRLQSLEAKLKGLSNKVAPTPVVFAAPQTVAVPSQTVAAPSDTNTLLLQSLAQTINLLARTHSDKRD